MAFTCRMRRFVLLNLKLFLLRQSTIPGRLERKSFIIPLMGGVESRPLVFCAGSVCLSLVGIVDAGGSWFKFTTFFDGTTMMMMMAHNNAPCTSPTTAENVVGTCGRTDSVSDGACSSIRPLLQHNFFRSTLAIARDAVRATTTTTTTTTSQCLVGTLAITHHYPQQPQIITTAPPVYTSWRRLLICQHSPFLLTTTTAMADP